MLKVTALYTPPTDPEAFEAHYPSRHAPLVDAMPGLIRQETAWTAGTAECRPAPYYRGAHRLRRDAADLRGRRSRGDGRSGMSDPRHDLDHALRVRSGGPR